MRTEYMPGDLVETITRVAAFHENDNVGICYFLEGSKGVIIYNHSYYEDPQDQNYIDFCTVLFEGEMYDVYNNNKDLRKVR